jgi:hypothetical protein
MQPKLLTMHLIKPHCRSFTSNAGLGNRLGRFTGAPKSRCQSETSLRNHPTKSEISFQNVHYQTNFKKNQRQHGQIARGMEIWTIVEEREDGFISDCRERDRRCNIVVWGGRREISTDGSVLFPENQRSAQPTTEKVNVTKETRFSYIHNARVL